MTAADYINKLLSHEEYAFSIEELMQKSNKGEVAIKRELSRLVTKRQILNLRKGFYLIITPRYASGKIPVQLYAEKLFRYLNRNYYIGLYSAAKLHGASHQQIQRDYIIIERPKLTDIKRKGTDIRFFTISHWPKKNMDVKKADAGNFLLSSPALTIADLVHNHTKLGGLNRMLATIEELAEVTTENDFDKLLSWYPYKSALQRVGFLLDSVLGENDLTHNIYSHLKANPYYSILLSPKENQNAGSANNRWKIDVNIKLESDL